MSKEISWNLQAAIKKGHFDEFAKLVQEMVASTEKEPGTTAYEWFVNADKSSCHIYERYADSDAVMLHLGNFAAKFDARFLACLEPTSMIVYGAPSAPVREALSGLGAEFFSMIGGFNR